MPRRPALYAPRPTPGWSHPYAIGPFSPVLYNTPPAPVPPAPAPAVPPVEPPKPGPPTSTVTMTQDDLNALAAKEKAQGQRAGERAALEKFAADNGFTNIDDAKTFIEVGRKAQEDKLTEQQKRENELAAREQAITAKEAAATERERAANRRAILVGLGAVGDDLADAAALLRVDGDADDAAITAAAEALKARRPELFGATAAPLPPGTPPPAPGGAPAGGPPQRQAPTGKPGDRGRAIALARGHKAPA